MKNNYLKSIYETEDTQYKKEYFDIVNFYKEHPIEKHSVEECLKDPMLYSEIQHINPGWYFKHNNLPCDNSENNIVRVPYKEHVRMHILLAKHFKEIHDIENYKCAIYAVQMMTWNGKKCMRSFDVLSENTLNELLDIRLEAQKIRSEFTKNQHKNGAIKPWRKFTPEFIDMVEKLYNENEDGYAAVSKFTDHFRDENHIRLFLWQFKRKRKHKDFALKGKPQKYTEEFIRNLHKLYVEHDDGKTSPWFFLRKNKLMNLSNKKLMALFDSFGLKYQKYDITNIRKGSIKIISN